jgi:hypothetical protein
MIINKIRKFYSTIIKSFNFNSLIWLCLVIVNSCIVFSYYNIFSSYFKIIPSRSNWWCLNSLFNKSASCNFCFKLKTWDLFLSSLCNDSCSNYNNLLWCLLFISSMISSFSFSLDSLKLKSLRSKDFYISN